MKVEGGNGLASTTWEDCNVDLVSNLVCLLVLFEIVLSNPPSNLINLHYFSKIYKNLLKIKTENLIVALEIITKKTKHSLEVEDNTRLFSSL